MQAEVWRHLERHHGVISRREAAGLGLSKGQIDRLLGSGHWTRVFPGVFRARGSPDSWHGNARAAALSVDGLVSHRAGAAVWTIDGFRQGEIEVVVPWGRRAARSNVTVHHSKQMDRADPTEVDGVPVTGPARTVLDVAGVVGRRRLEWTVDAVLRQGLLEWPDLYQVLVRHSRRGRDGCGRLRELLDVRFGSSVVPDSKWNRMAAQLLTDHGLPMPVLEHEIRDGDGILVGRVDLAYPNHRLAIELDSVRYHLNRESFEADPRRKNRIMLEGWRILTFTWADFNDRPLELVRLVRSALSTPEIERISRA